MEEIRLLRRLIEEATSPNLKMSLTLALAKCLSQEAERTIKSNEMLSAGAVHLYVDKCMETIARVLQDQLPEEQMFLIVDLISEGLAALTPRNTAADLKLLK
ncbi:hypothetical protein PLANPX_3834 [Lacipirellula parvula]|uniref:Uncharacterized protein n=1 Tax=Lacipirellula parvula TaxID=2650471 RepID=A0A5K7XDY0_9BACT|nr:hypothetical protein PLANPX_3834 [Lacipirellula parvula]